MKRILLAFSLLFTVVLFSCKDENYGANGSKVYITVTCDSCEFVLLNGYLEENGNFSDNYNFMIGTVKDSVTYELFRYPKNSCIRVIGCMNYGTQPIKMIYIEHNDTIAIEQGLMTGDCR